MIMWKGKLWSQLIVSLGLALKRRIPTTTYRWPNPRPRLQFNLRKLWRRYEILWQRWKSRGKESEAIEAEWIFSAMNNAQTKIRVRKLDF